MSHVTQAVVFVLSQYLIDDVDRCLRYCTINRYRVVAVVTDNLRQALDFLDTTQSVLVVADARHIDPRLEVAADPPSPDGRPRPRLTE